MPKPAPPRNNRPNEKNDFGLMYENDRLDWRKYENLLIDVLIGIMNFFIIGPLPMFVSRLGQYYRRILRDDIATRFGKRAEIQSLEVSIIADSSVFMSGDVRYRAGCAFELLTGSSPKYYPIDLKAEGLDYALYGGPSAGREKDRFKMLKASGTLRGLVGVHYKQMVTSSSGSRLSSTLDGDQMYLFIERLRELYFPDIDFRKDNTRVVKNPVARRFREWTENSNPQKPSVVPIRVAENPAIASSAYVLRLHELNKVPELEYYFEGLSTILSGQHINLFLLLRPTVKVTSLAIEPEDEFLCASRNYEVMDYLLSTLFNPEMERICYTPKTPFYPPPRIINLEDIKSE